MDAILFLQRFSSPALDAFFLAATGLGGEVFFLLALPLFFWCARPAFAIRMAVLIFAAGWAQDALKELYRTERPDEALWLAFEGEDLGFAYPSGHALTATVFWGYLATRVRSRPLIGAAVLAIALVALSRVYLGVHWPHDVLGGVLFGAAILGLATMAEAPLAARLSRLRTGSALGLALAGSAALALVTPGEIGIRVAGAMGGAAAGFALLRRLAPEYDGGGDVARLAQRVLVGLLVLLALRFGIKAVLPDVAVAHYVRYLLMGWWVALGPPLVVPAPIRRVSAVTVSP